MDKQDTIIAIISTILLVVAALNIDKMMVILLLKTCKNYMK